MRKSTKLQAFQKCATKTTGDNRHEIIGEFMEGIGKEWDTITGDDRPFIHMTDAIRWMYDNTLSDKQVQNKYRIEAAKIIELKDPMCEEGTDWCQYTPSGQTKKGVYLTTSGLACWAISIGIPKSYVVKAFVIKGFMRSMAIMRSPVKKRKPKKITETPPQKRMKKNELHVSMVDHSVLDELLDILASIDRAKSQVYFIWDGKFMKIGLTRRGALKRVKNLQTGSYRTMEVFRTIQTDNPEQLEKFLHSAFGEKRVRGEWFEVTEEEISDLVKHIG